MKIRKRDRVIVGYSLTLEKESLVKILDKDEKMKAKPLYEQLLEIDGVSEVEYDGHYGPQIYINLDPKYDYSSTWAAIYGTIEDYLK